jgi:2-dehydro-3-deoxygalactonokinase
MADAGTGGELTGRIDWVAADWGTSRLRLWAMAADGRVLARRESGQGMGRLSRADFEPVLRAALAGWMPADRALQVLACGMVGSRQGWVEAPYRDLPAAPIAPDDLTSPPMSSDDLYVRIVPGLSQSAPADVMRGEETQIAGLIACAGVSEGLVCLPGTHSKWVRLENGTVRGFRTSMTGELFALLSESSVLRHSLAAGPVRPDHPLFARAVGEMLARPEMLIAALFSIRAAALAPGAKGARDAAAGRARLSGLLIGAELSAMRDWWCAAQKVTLIGAPEIGAAYLRALNLAGVAAVLQDGDEMALAGLAALHAKSREDIA